MRFAKLALPKIALAGIAAVAIGFIALPVLAQEKAGEAKKSHGEEIEYLEPKGGWKQEGFFGTFDPNALQRGFKVYREICSNCHGLKLVAFRTLGEEGGPFYDPAYPNPNDNKVVKALADSHPNKINGVDPDTGDAAKLAPKTSDMIPSPFANNIAARNGNGGALPPDLSVIAKARHGGESYVYSLLQGYDTPPAGLTVNAGQYYNRFFSGDTSSQWAGDPREKPEGGFLAMKPPLEGQKVEFDDGTEGTQEQMARDVATFLAWTADPKAVARKQMGVAVIPFMLILAILVFISYRRIWRNVEH